MLGCGRLPGPIDAGALGPISPLPLPLEPGPFIDLAPEIVGVERGSGLLPPSASTSFSDTLPRAVGLGRDDEGKGGAPPAEFEDVRPIIMPRRLDQLFVARFLPGDSGGGSAEECVPIAPGLDGTALPSVLEDTLRVVPLVSFGPVKDGLFGTSALGLGAPTPARPVPSEGPLEGPSGPKDGPVAAGGSPADGAEDGPIEDHMDGPKEGPEKPRPPLPLPKRPTPPPSLGAEGFGRGRSIVPPAAAAS